DKNNMVWLATNRGVELFDIQTKRSISTFWNNKEYNSLSSNSIYSIYVDKEDRKWIGTSKGGVNILDPSKHKFKVDNSIWTVSRNLSSSFVRSFMEPRPGLLWIGTDGGGISIWNRQTNNLKTIQKGEDGLTDNVINKIIKDRQERIWIATSDGIQQYREGHGFKRYACYNDKGEENKNIEVVLEDSDRVIWATTFGNGKLYKYNQSRDIFLPFSTELRDVITLSESPDGILWGGNHHELIKINKHTGSFEVYEIGKPVRAIHFDRNNRMWVGTEGRGLIRFNWHMGHVDTTFADNEGLCNNSILTIEEDDSGNLWLSTFDGLSRFDPIKSEFTNFDQSDGLQGNEFSYGASLRLQDGQLAFGGVNGFNLFHPDSIPVRTHVPHLAITEIRINNRILSDSSNHIVLDEEHRIREIILPFDQAILSFNYAALEFSSPHKISYRYMLSGLDKEWNLAGTTRSINFNNLREGRYTLVIESTNAEGEWANNPAELHIRVLPPWYRSWWAYVIYASGALLFLRIYIRYRNRQTKLKYEIRLANLTAKKERELHEKRQSFFTNVSHEFRTPLTLIINPVKGLLRENQSDKEKAKLRIVKRNAKRLLSLVDQLLLFRKAEGEVDNIKMSRFDAIAFSREIYLCFLHQAQQQSITYDFETDL